MRLRPLPGAICVSSTAARAVPETSNMKAMNENERQDLPGNVDENVQVIARLHATHARSATPAERMVERLVAFLGRPAFAGLLTLFAAAWIGANLWLGRSRQAFD